MPAKTEKTVAVRGVADFDKAIAETRRYGRSFTALTREMERANMRAGRLQRTLNGFFRASAVVGSVYAMSRAMGLLAENAGRTEAALAGVSKTTEIVGKDLELLGERLLRASVDMGSARIEMLGVAKVAGQLGIHGARDLGTFTVAITKLAEATNITAEEGATNLARFLFLTGNETTEIDRVASSIVHLGNNVAAQETEILRMATAISQTTASLELQDTTISGWAATVAAAGLRVESTSNAIFRFIEGIQRAGSVGGKALEGLAAAMELSVRQTQELINLDVDAFVRKLIPALATVDPTSVTNLLYALGIDDIRTHRSINTTIQQERSIGAFTRNIGLAESQGSDALALNAEYQRQRDTLLRDMEAITQRIGISMEKMSSVIVAKLLPAYETLADVLERLAAQISTIVKVVGFIFSALPLGVGGAAVVGGRRLIRAVFGSGRRADINPQEYRNFVLPEKIRGQAGVASAEAKQAATFLGKETERLSGITRNTDFSIDQRLAAAKAIGEAEFVRRQALFSIGKDKAPSLSAIRADTDALAKKIGDEVSQAFTTSLYGAAAAGAGAGLIGGLSGHTITRSFESGQADITRRRTSLNQRAHGFASAADLEEAMGAYVRNAADVGASQGELAESAEELRMKLEKLAVAVEQQEMTMKRVRELITERYFDQDSPGGYDGGRSATPAERFSRWVDAMKDDPEIGPFVSLLLLNRLPNQATNALNNTAVFDEVNEGLDSIAGDQAQNGLVGAHMTLEKYRNELRSAIQDQDAFNRAVVVEESLEAVKLARRGRVLKELEEDQIGYQRKRLQVIKDEIAYGQDITANEKEFIKNRRTILDLSDKIAENAKIIEQNSGFGEDTEQTRRKIATELVNQGLALQINFIKEINEELMERIKLEEKIAAIPAERLFGLDRALYLLRADQGRAVQRRLNEARVPLSQIQQGNAQQTGIATHQLIAAREFNVPSSLVMQENAALQAIEMHAKGTEVNTEEISEHGQKMLQRLGQLNASLQETIASPLQALLIGESVSEAMGRALIQLGNVIIATAIVAPVVDAMEGILNRIAADILGIELDKMGKPVDINAAGATINIFGGDVQSGGSGGDTPGWWDAVTDFFSGGSGGGSSTGPAGRGPGQTGPQAARGGILTRGGLITVGEQGAEIVRLPEGAEVYPAGSVPADMMGGNVNITNYYTINARDGDDIRQVLQEETPKMVDQAKAAIIRDAGRRTTRIAGSIRQAAAA